jgi:hypothetical protein
VNRERRGGRRDRGPSGPGDRRVRAAITDPGRLRHYAEAARSLAATEIPGTFDPDIDTDEAVRFRVLGTVLYDPVLLALRKLAHVDRIREVARDWPPVENTTAN